MLLSTDFLYAGSWDDPFLISDVHSNRISIAGNYFFASTAITNRFIQNYYLGKFLDNSLKDDVSKNLNNRNRFGAEINASVCFTHNRKRSSGLKEIAWFAGLVDRYHADSRFRQDAFELFFRGNKDFAGRMAILDDFDFKWFSYQQFLFGIEKAVKRKNGKLTWTAGVYFNKGDKYYSINAPTANLYTATDGYYLDVDLNLTIRQSDSAHLNIDAFNGFGFSGILGWAYEDVHQNLFSLKADNFGFIRWNDHSAVVPADSSFRFIGIDASDLFDFTDSIKGKISSDSAFVQGFLNKRVKKSFLTPVPFNLEASYFANLIPGRFGIRIGTDYLFFANYKAHFWGEAAATFRNRHRLLLKLSYGGYTGWNAGLGYDLRIGRGWLFHVQSDFLGAMLNSRFGTAQGAFVSLSKFF